MNETSPSERYDNLRLVGRGGMGSVYRAHDKQAGRDVAVKVMHPGAAGASGSLRFDREARLLAELQHPALVEYFDHGIDPSGQPFIVMEWLEGEDLDARLTRGPLSLTQALDLLLRVAGGLGAAHERGIVHRDVKPSNVFLVDGDPAKAKLLDFGVARRTQRSAAMTRTGSVLGTVGYMSPEQARGESDIDARADVFALGCVAFECITGRVVYSGPTPLAVLAKVLTHEPIPLLRTYAPQASEELEALLARMLAPARDDRPANGAEVRRALASIDVQGDDRTLPGAPPRRANEPTRERRIYSAILTNPPSLSDETMTLEEVTRHEHIAVDLASRFGAQAQELGGGALVVVMADTGDVLERASRAAACALAIADSHPERLVALATGRSETFDGASGKMIDRAAALLLDAEPGRVMLDELSARLLESRYEIGSDERRCWLGSLRAAGAVIPRFLGRATPLVGRGKELEFLVATWEECLLDVVTRAVLVTGEAGSGKTRLLGEFLAKADLKEARVLRVRADPVGAGSSAALARQLVRQGTGLDAAGAHYGILAAHIERLVVDDAERATRVAQLLGELVGAKTDEVPCDALRAARNDARMMHTWIERSMVDWVEAMARQRPLLIVLEDLHWGDHATVGYIEAALRRLPDAPLMVLAIARDGVHEQFAHLFAPAQPPELRLGALTPRAAKELARAVLGADVPEETVRGIIARAEGNAFYLEELMRAVAEGRGGELPETVLAMVQSRLEALEPDARRVLSAAAVFGDACWDASIARVGRLDGRDTEGWLRLLVDRELLDRRIQSRFPNTTEYVFRHNLVREAAYALWSEGAREAAHLDAANWLEAAGETDARIMVEHLERAREEARLVGWLVAAGEGAFATGNLVEAERLAARGLELHPQDEMRARLLAIRAAALGWGLRHEEAVDVAAQAQALLPVASNEWFRMTGSLYNAVNTGNHEATARMIEALMRAPRVMATGPCGFAYTAALSAFATLGDRDKARSILERIAVVPVDEHAMDPAFEGWRSIQLECWERYFERGMGHGLLHATRAARMFARAGDPLGGMQAMVSEASWRVVSGPAERVIELADLIDTGGSTMGVFHGKYASILRAMVLVGRDPAAALALLEPYLQETNLLYAVPAHIICGAIHAATSDRARAEAHSAALRDMPSAFARCAAAAIDARLALGAGDFESAAKVATQGLEFAASRSALVGTVLDLHLLRLEAARAGATSSPAATVVKEAASFLNSMVEGMLEDDARAFAATSRRRRLDALLAELHPG